MHKRWNIRTAGSPTYHRPWSRRHNVALEIPRPRAIALGPKPAARSLRTPSRDTRTRGPPLEPVSRRPERSDGRFKYTLRNSGLLEGLRWVPNGPAMAPRCQFCRGIRFSQCRKTRKTRFNRIRERLRRGVAYSFAVGAARARANMPTVATLRGEHDADERGPSCGSCATRSAMRSRELPVHGAR